MRGNPAVSHLVLSSFNIKSLLMLYLTASMLASQLNDLVTSGQLQQHTVFRLTNYQSSMLQGTK